MKSQQFASHRKSASTDSPSSYLLINNLLNINCKINVPKKEQPKIQKNIANGSVTDRSNNSLNKSAISRKHNLEPKEKPNSSKIFTAHKKSNSFSSKVKKVDPQISSPSWNFLEEESVTSSKIQSQKVEAKPMKIEMKKEKLLESIKSSISSKSPFSQRQKNKDISISEIVKKPTMTPSPISQFIRELNNKSFLHKSKFEPVSKGTKQMSKNPSKENTKSNILAKRAGSFDYGNGNSSFSEIRGIDLKASFLTQNQRKIRYASRTRQGYLASFVGKVNQDAIISLPNLFKKNDIHLFAVADGHGVNGHLVSNFVLYHLSDLLSKDKDLMVNPRKAFMKAFHSVAKSLAESSIDSTLSGTTVNVVLINGPKVYCANCGDSRAVMAKRKASSHFYKEWEFVPLSRDHKPTSEGEYERIKLMGGRVEPIMESDGSYVGPSRVWLMEDNLPGLAMSRSMGDYIAAQVGVISEPEIIETILDNDTKFIVLASDGVWENIESNEVLIVDLVREYDFSLLRSE